MGFFRRSGIGFPKILWQYTTTGRLWKLVPAGGKIFVGEDRDIESKRTTFFCIERDTGEVRWKDIQFAEPWWIDIETVYRGTLLLHEFGNPSLPDHRKIIAVDLLTGQVLWRRDDLRFETACDDTVVGSLDRFEGRQFVCLDLRTGIAKDKSVTEESISLYRKTGSDPDPGIEFPVRLNPDTSPPHMILAALRKDSGRHEGNESLEYLVKGNSLLISRAIMEQAGDGTRKTTQLFLVADRARGTVVFRDVIDRDLHLPLPDPFFTIRSMVYYIKNKRTLIALALGERTMVG